LRFLYTSAVKIDSCYREKLHRLDVPIPPISEQKRITAKMQELFSLADLAETSLLEANKKLDDLDRMILFKGLSGRLVRQEPTDEPVSCS
jgi:type I restriction enzyme, S subunit